MPESKEWSDFLLWETASRDTVDFKTIYVDIADDLVAGLLLSQIVYWYLPSKKGRSKLRVFKDGYYWIAKTRTEWWNEIRVKPRQVDRALKILEEKGIIVAHIYRYDNAPTIHIRIVKERFLIAWNNALSRINETVKSEAPSDPFSPNLQFDLTDSSNPNDEMVKSDLPESAKSLTENTIDSTEITTENTYAADADFSDFPETPQPGPAPEARKERPDDDQLGPESASVPNRLDEENSGTSDQEPAGAALLRPGVQGQAGLSLPDGGRNHASAGEKPDALTFDLARATASARAEAGGAWTATPAGGGDDGFQRGPVDAFCEVLAAVPPAQLPQGMRESWGNKLHEIAKEWSTDESVITPEIMEAAIRAIPDDSEIGWKSFSSPYSDNFDRNIGPLLLRNGQPRQKKPGRAPDPGKYDRATAMTLERLRHGDR